MPLELTSTTFAPNGAIPMRCTCEGDDVIKIGVLTDNSGLYSDLGGAGSTVAAQMAVEDSGLAAKGWKIDIISATEYEKEKAERDKEIKAALAEEAEAQRQQEEARQQEKAQAESEG